jgi:RNA polymerase sigma factor (sigma-70 family)
MVIKRHRKKSNVDALQIFFKDVARVPKINGKSDYIPMLRLIRRATTLRKLATKTHEATFQKVTRRFLDTVNEFNQQCQTLNKPLLDLEKLAIEIESFLANPQQAMPLALVRCIGGSTWEQENEAILHFEELGWRCVYLSSLLPCCMRSLQSPLVYSKEVESLFEQILNEGKITKNRLVEGTLRYVINIAYHYVGKGVPYLDLIQEGAIGLDRAAELFDERKGVHFQIYAASWIRQRITRYIADTSRLIRMPVHANDKVAEIEQTVNNLIEQQNNSVAEMDLFVAMGWLTKTHSTEINQQKRRMKLRKQVQKYQRLFSYCPQNDELTTSEQLPNIVGLSSIYEQLRISTGKEPTVVELLSAMEWLTEEEVKVLEELALDKAELNEIYLKVSKIKREVEQVQHRYLKNKNIPIYLWPKVIELQHTQWRLTKLNNGELSSLQVFEAVGWLTENDVELINQYEDSQYALILSPDTTQKLAKAHQQMEFYHIANAVHLSLEDTRFQSTSVDSILDISEVLVSQTSLEQNYNCKALSTAVKNALSGLSERQKLIITLRFGLNDGQEHTLEEIAQPLRITRERIRQIEARALDRLKHPRRSVKLKEFTDTDDSSRVNFRKYQTLLLEKFQSIEETLNDEEHITQEKETIENFIRQYVTKGRRKIWDTRRQSSRAELLREVLENLGQPAHYSEIHDKALELVPESLQFSKKVTYSTLFYRTDCFRPFGSAVFGLTSWSTYSTETNGEQILQHCPTPLLPTNPYVTSFFESVMVGHELLKHKSLTARQFLTEMTAWAKGATLTKTEGQNAFDAWYAAGLLSPIDFLNNSDSTLDLTIPADIKLNEIRNHCLNTLCRRVLKMPELLLTIDRIARPTVATIQKVLFGGERSGFDLSTRLEMLAAFEAIQSDSGEWRLTDLGRVILEINPPQELPDFGEIEAFQESVEPAVQVEWDEELGLLDI